MDTKREIVEKIGFLIAGGDNTADLRDRFHENVIEAVITESMDTMLQNAYRQSSSKMGASDFAMLDVYTKRYKDVPVLQETNSGEYYSVLPVKVISLGNNDGIRFIYEANDRKRSNPFYKLVNGSGSVYDNLPSGKIKSENRYYPEGDLTFYDFMNPHAIPEKVTMFLIPSFSELEDTDVVDEVSIVGKDGFLTLTNLVIQTLRGMPATKTTSGDNLTKNV